MVNHRDDWRERFSGASGACWAGRTRQTPSRRVSQGSGGARVRRRAKSCTEPTARRALSGGEARGGSARRGRTAVGKRAGGGGRQRRDCVAPPARCRTSRAATRRCEARWARSPARGRASQRGDCWSRVACVRAAARPSGPTGSWGRWRSRARASRWQAPARSASTAPAEPRVQPMAWRGGCGAG
eukprot:scaffold111516_cov39-Phaeocystis_antarctica.AAC.6